MGITLKEQESYLCPKMGQLTEIVKRLASIDYWSRASNLSYTNGKVINFSFRASVHCSPPNSQVTRDKLLTLQVRVPKSRMKKLIRIRSLSYGTDLEELPQEWTHFLDSFGTFFNDK